jgi:DNA replication protein DnaC
VEDRRHPHAGGNWRGRFEIAAAYEVKAATDRPGNPALVDLWKRADLFAIDDLGVQRVNDWDAEHLHALIDTRWQHRRPTILASNVADLRTVLGPRAASRLADGATLVRFTGADRRRAS